MQALRFYEPGKVAVVDVPDPVAGPGEVILKVHSTGLCNSDVRVYLGEKHATAGVIPGHEVTGEVVSVGEGAAATTGEVVALCPMQVCGHCYYCLEGYRNRCINRVTLGYEKDGGIAEYVRVPAQLVGMGHLLPIDPSIPPHIRSLVEPIACVLHSTESIGVRVASPVAIVGSGPMGLAHLIVAQRYGAGPILVVEPDAGRREVALELGADAAVAPEEAAEAAREMTKGRGFPSTAMAVGFADAVPTALAVTANMGAINLFAGFPPGSSHALDLNKLHYSEIRLLGTQNAPVALYARAAGMVGMLPGLDRIVTNRYPLAEADKAYSARLDKTGLKSAVVMS